MSNIQLASSLLFSQSFRSIYPKNHFCRVTPSLKKGSAVPAWVSLAPGLQVQQSCAWEAAGAAGHSQLYSRCHLSTPTKAARQWGEDVGWGWRVRWCMKRCRVAGSTLPPTSHFFVLTGLHTGTVLLWAISIGKKGSKPRDSLVNDLPVLANLV